MILTEEGARKKLCPYVLCEKIIKDDLGISIMAVVTVHNTFCVASDCICWEWVEDSNYYNKITSAQQEMKKNVLYGYCDK